MANQMFVYPWPRGVDNTQHEMQVEGSVVLAGSAVATGEPIDWSSLVSGIPYNETNWLGKGSGYNTGSALVTALSASGGTITATAANNFSVGQQVTFKGCTTALGLLLNGLTFTVATASTSQFTFLSAATGSGSGEVGLAYQGIGYQLVAKASGALKATVTSLAVSGGIITVTATNSYLPGCRVTFAGLSTALGALMNGLTFIVLQSTGSAFTIASGLTGGAGSDSGTASGNNPPQPHTVRFWSAAASGFIYQYNEIYGTLFGFEGGAGTPAGTIVSTSTAPTITTTSGGVSTALGVAAGALSEVTGASGITGVQAPTITSTFTGTPGSAGALTPLGAGAYPSGVLADIVKFSARFARGL
jgi:hypothetical protein